MDWELYERYKSTLLLAGLLLVSSLFLAFQKSSSIQHVRAFLVRFTLPPQRFLSLQSAGNESTIVSTPSPVETSVPTSVPEAGEVVLAEEGRKIQLLRDENKRLHDVLQLKQEKWPRAIVCHVAGRDPQRWFQDIVLDKGREEGLVVDAPVIAVVNGREALAGRIVDVSAHISKAMLLQDSLSAVAATVPGAKGEDGVVEGTNSHDLILKFLDRGSQVKVGDQVLTSGLGESFPPGVPIGWISVIEPDPRQLFLQAKLQPAAQSNQLRVVLVLVP